MRELLHGEAGSFTPPVETRIGFMDDFKLEVSSKKPFDIASYETAHEAMPNRVLL